MQTFKSYLIQVQLSLPGKTNFDGFQLRQSDHPRRKPPSLEQFILPLPRNEKEKKKEQEADLPAAMLLYDALRVSSTPGECQRAHRKTPKKVAEEGSLQIRCSWVS